MDMERRGNYIKEKRDLKGFTQEKLAERVGVSTRTIGNWENGSQDIKLDNASKLAEVLEVKVQELIIGKDIDDIDSKDHAEFDKWIKEINKLSIRTGYNSITAMDVAISAFGTSIITAAIAMWAAFGDGLIVGIVCMLLGLFGILFIVLGRRIIIGLNKRLEEKEKISMS